MFSAILTPPEGGPSERTVTLGQLIGRIKNGGAAALQGFKEDRRNAAKSVQPLYYGAFSSYGPAYDSTFANLTKQASHCVHLSSVLDPDPPVSEIVWSQVSGSSPFSHLTMKYRIF